MLSVSFAWFSALLTFALWLSKLVLYIFWLLALLVYLLKSTNVLFFKHTHRSISRFIACLRTQISSHIQDRDWFPLGKFRSL